MVDLFFRDLGGAGRPPLVILHGLLGASRNWQSAGRDLSARYHVFALDLRNHGASPHAPTMTYPEMAADVAAWMDRQGISRATLMGHSMGGKTAMTFACAYPARVERLVIVDIVPKDYHSAAHRAEFAAMNELELDVLTTRGEAELRFEARVSDWAMRKFLATNLERTEEGKWRWQIDLAAITAALPVLERDSLAPTDRYDGPATFIFGGKSRYSTPADYPAIATHFLRATFAVIPTSGHNPHMDSREAFVALVP